MSGGFSPAAVRGTALTVHHDRWHPRHAVLSTKSHPRPTQTSTPVCGRSVSLMLVVMSRDVHVLEIDFSAELAKAAGKTTQRVPPHELGARLTNKLFSMLYCTNITTEQYIRPKQYRGFFPWILVLPRPTVSLLATRTGADLARRHAHTQAGSGMLWADRSMTRCVSVEKTLSGDKS